MHPTQRTLIRYVDRAVAERVRGAVARHVADCVSCRATVDALSVVRASGSPPPLPSPDLLNEAIRRRSAGERLVLPAPTVRVGPRTWRVAALAVIGAAAVVAVTLVPTPDGSWTEEECMSGLRSLFTTLVIGSSVACADTPWPVELPDSAYQPIMSLAADRVLAGRYVYDEVMWTDGEFMSEQATREIFLRTADYAGRPAWEARTTITRRYGRGGTREAWFDRASLSAIRGSWFNHLGGLIVAVEVTEDSILVRTGFGPNKDKVRAHPRAAGIAVASGSFTHWMAILGALPLTDGWAGSVSGTLLRVVGQEEITVPAGTFRCWRLESPGQSWRGWVAIDHPIVVRTETGPIPDRRAIRLVSFELEGP